MSIIPEPATAGNIDQLEFHPLADTFPLMEGAEFDELTADIEVNGLKHAIVLYEGKILDGRNRYRACLAAGVEPTAVDGDGGIDNPRAFVISANIHRRHLTAEQKRELIERLIKAEPEKSNRQVAKATGVSHEHVRKVRGELEESGDVATVATSIDTKGRRQPAKQSSEDKEAARASKAARAEAERERATARKRKADWHEWEEAEAKQIASALVALNRELVQRLQNFFTSGGYGDTLSDALSDALQDALCTQPAPDASPKRRGRPPGSKNKVKPSVEVEAAPATAEAAT
jgi:hypothetical protein